MLNERQGRVLKPDEIEAMRKVCKVRAHSPIECSHPLMTAFDSSAVKCSTLPAQRSNRA